MAKILSNSVPCMLFISIFACFHLYEQGLVGAEGTVVGIILGKA